MIPQLVVERPLFPVQVQDAALVRVEQQDLPQRIVLARPENPIQARERAVNNALQFQIYDRILLQGKLIQSAEDTHTLLLSENETLRKHIIGRTESLEKEWLGVAEQLSVKVDTFYCSANAFFQRFGPENQAATQIRNDFKDREPSMVCVPNKMWLMFQGYNFCGVSDEDMDSLWYYRHSPEVDKVLPAIEQLHVTGGEALKARVKAEIQKIQNEMLIEEPKEPIPLLNPNDAVAIDEGDVLQVYLQGRQDEIQFLEERNLPLRNENAYLEKKKIELMNMDERLFAVFDKPLEPCFEWVKFTKKMIECFGPNCKDFPQKYDRRPHLQVHIGKASEYTGGYQLKIKFGRHLKEIELLLEALQKKEPS